MISLYISLKLPTAETSKSFKSPSLMKQGGPSKVGGRAAAVAKQTRSSLAWKASENRSALSSSELGYHIKIIHLLSHASHHHQSLAVMLW
jgi:hypothetical protein